MSKPSLHELITDEIVNYTLDVSDDPIPRTMCEELAEDIIKIVRDYHLVEDEK